MLVGLIVLIPNTMRPCFQSCHHRRFTPSITGTKIITNNMFTATIITTGMKVHLLGNTTEWLSPIERFYDATELLPGDR